MRPWAVVLSGLMSATVAFAAGTPGEPPKTKVRPDVLAAVEKELERLHEQAGRESGPQWPRPSQEVAFLLLAGLAARGEPIPEPSAEERRQFGLDQAGAKTQLVAVADDARLVKVERWVQDKAGSYQVLGWHLYRRQGEQWVERGRGETVAGE